MTVLRILLAIMMVTILPMLVGMVFLPLKEKGARALLAWIGGQLLLWAGFLVICVPMVLTGSEFSMVRLAYFAFCGAAALVSLLVFFLGKGRRKEGDGGTPKAAEAKAETPKAMKVKAETPESKRKKHAELALWGVFAMLLLIQVFCVFFLRYEDGDDAYYVAITTYSKEVGAMYRNIPYTGAYSGLDLRHSLAPFPVWVAVFADVAGLSGAITAHVLMPLLILAMTYALYYLLGESLLGEKDGKGWKMPLFLCFAALLVLFGGYSIYSAENFLIVRAGQGKAVLANVVIPSLLYATVLLTGRLEKKEKIPFSQWVLLCGVMMAGCLCSTLGTFLLCVFLGVVTLCALVIYRSWKLLPGVLVSLLAPAVMAGLYVFWG